MSHGKQALVQIHGSAFVGCVGMILMAVCSASGLARGAEPQTLARGSEMPSATIQELGGERKELAMYWMDGPVVLVVLRGYPGYQCPLCTRQVAELVKSAEMFQKHGAKVVFIYPGLEPMLDAKAGDFLRGTKLPEHFRMVIDNDCRLVSKLGLRWDAKSETAYPSTFVIAKGGRIEFVKTSRSHGGRASAMDVTQVLESLSGSTPSSK